jgi:phospholipid/cholesterol/gamma-HCH transport system substrate-binding protein
MERNANYALVGVVSLALFVALVAFVVWLAGFSFNRKFDIYDIVFIGPVRGLSEGGEVHFNGIKVGEVSDISLDAKDPNRVIARARLKEGVPVRVDSFATLEPQGITGVNYVQVTAGTTSKPLLKDTVTRDVIPVINSQKSALSDLLEGGGTVLQRTVQALDQVNKLLSNENVRSITTSMHNVEDLTAQLKKREKLLDDAQQTLRDVDAATLSFKKLADTSTNLVNGEGRQTLSRLAKTADELQQTAASARTMIAGLQGPTSDFATNGLPQLTSTIATLQRSAENLNALVAEARQSPRNLITKAPAKEVEVKP